MQFDTQRTLIADTYAASALAQKIITPDVRAELESRLRSALSAVTAADACYDDPTN